MHPRYKTEYRVGNWAVYDRALVRRGDVTLWPVRRYVATLKVATAPKEGYVHRSVRPGTTMEVDFGESWAEVAGVPRKVKYLVATLPYSNVYFAKAYPLERLESLLDGIESAFTYFGGVVDRVVLDNTSLAVKAVLAGRDRLETEAFAAFRGAYPFRAEFCAPAKGWEKGSVETGVKYVRNLVFRPRLAVESWAALNALLITELEADLPPRHLDDGRPVQAAWRLERQHLRALPMHRPATCRIVARVVDKFGHVRVDHETYSVPIRHAYRPVWVKLYHDRVAVAVGAEVVAQHPRAFRRGAKVLDARHVLPLLERKHRADDRWRQLPAQSRHTQPSVPRDTGGAKAIALVATTTTTQKWGSLFKWPKGPFSACHSQRGLVGAMPPLRRCRVGGGAHRRARLRPPLKRYVRFSRIPLSQGCPGAERWRVLTSGPSALLWD